MDLVLSSVLILAEIMRSAPNFQLIKGKWEAA